MHRDANRARLIGDCTGCSLANPPSGICRKLITTLILKLLNRLHKASVALLNKVKEAKPTVHVFFHDGDDETKVRLHHLSSRNLPGLENLAKLRKCREKFLSRHSE